MRYRGTLVQWHDERGFGWIEADAGGEKLFVHISAFVPRPQAEQRPQPGQRLEFAVGLENGKKRAQQVGWRSRSQPQTGSQPRARSAQTTRAAGWHASRRFSYGVLLAWLLLMLAGSVFWSMPRWIWLAYAGLSALTFMVYWQDKWSAQQGRWRTPENTLQALALLGGWPGAVLAQQWLRHKSSKTSFQLQFWRLALLNVAALLWLLASPGRHWPT